MSSRRSHTRRVFIISGLSFMTVGGLGLSAVAQAQSQSFFSRIRDIINPRRRSQTASGRSRGGSVRGRCVAPERADTRLTALIPNTNLGLTISAYPTFWFYIPYQRTDDINTAEFMLLDADRRPVLTKSVLVNLPETPGIVRFSLSPSAQPLDIGQEYNWHFSINCSLRHPSRNPGVSGWVRRVAEPPELAARLNTLPDQQHYLAYAEHEIWYEVLTELSQYRDRYPEDWSVMLQSMNLPEAVAQSSIHELQPVQ
jgi:hypothetical protein